MLKYIEEEYKKILDEVKDLENDQNTYESKLIASDEKIANIEQYLNLDERLQKNIIAFIIYSAFIAITLPVIALSFVMLLPVAIVDTTVGILDLATIVTMIKKIIVMNKLKKSIGVKNIGMGTLYEAHMENDDLDKYICGTKYLLMMKTRDAKLYKELVQSENILKELLNYPDILKKALEYEFEEYLKEVERIKSKDVHLFSPKKVDKVDLGLSYQLKLNN